MKCVIAFSCLLAVASAGLINTPIALGAYDDGSYKGEFYNGNIGVYAGALGYALHNPGTPAVAYNAPLVSAPHPIRVAHAYAAPLALGYAHAAPLALASEARLIDPVAIAAGAPLPTGDTVEVAAAKAAHLQAHAVAKGLAYGAPIAHAIAPIAPIAPLALASEARLIDPVAIAAGAPLPTGDTVEVAAAKAFHHQAHAVAKTLAHSGPIAHGYAHAAPLAYANHGSHAVAYNAPLVSAPHPVHVAYSGPLAHAFAAHTGPVAHGYAHASPIAHAYAHAAPIAHGYAHGYAHAAPIAHGYAHVAPLATQARLVDPVAIAAGAPLPTGDTVEVAAAKAAHFQAHHAAKAGHVGAYHG